MYDGRESNRCQFDVKYVTEKGMNLVARQRVLEISVAKTLTKYMLSKMSLSNPSSPMNCYILLYSFVLATLSFRTRCLVSVITFPPIHVCYLQPSP